MRIYNLSHNLEFRKKLRNNKTKPEAILWRYLKGRKLGGYKFRRQHGIGPYIVDFYCPELRLAIELDGKWHQQKDIKKYDEERSAYIESFFIKVIRFSNKEIFFSPNTVLQKVLKGLSVDHPHAGAAE